MNKGVIRVIVFFIGAILFSCGGFFLVRYGKHNSKDIIVNYSEKSKIDYKVFLKENEFFEKPYLEKNKTYIASLIDYLDIDFSYNVKYDENVSGYYVYYYKGIINANKSNNESGNYLTKEVKLSEEKRVDYNDTKNVDLNDKLKVVYDEYNKLLSDFKDKYAISIDGELIVSLEIENHITNEHLGREVLKRVSVPLSIPLTEQTIEVPIKSNNINKSSELYSDVLVDKDVKFFVAKVVGYISFAIAALSIVFLIKFGILRAKVVSEYNKKLNKILKVYDSIMVNVDEIPKTNKLNYIKVKSFEELVDAHSEVRKPINFSEDKNGATFTLLNEGNAWVYQLRKESIFED